MSIFGPSSDLAPLALTEDLTAGPRRPHSSASGDQFAVFINFRREDSPTAEQQLRVWKERASLDASRARLLAEGAPASAAASVRLAHAEHLAGEREAAITAARETFKRVKYGAHQGGGYQFDVVPAVAAARLLIQLGHAADVDGLLQDFSSYDVVRRFRAGIATDRGDFDRALRLLQTDDSSSAASLRGFVYLRLGESTKAIREIRKAWRVGPQVVDDVLNLALAFWDVGSTQKAILYARQASRLAPGRKDISFTLLEFLLSAGKPDMARTEIRSIQTRGYVEPPEFIYLQARTCLALGERNRGLTLLRQAKERAQSSEEGRLAAEIEGNLVYLESTKSADKMASRNAVKKLLDGFPESVVLVEVLASMIDRVSERDDLDQRIESLADHGWPKERLYHLRSRSAYLRCDFKPASKFAKLWSEHDKLDPVAASIHMMYLGQVDQDWNAAAKAAERALRRFGCTRQVVNNAAYALVLAGRPYRAAATLSKVEPFDYLLKATEGLVELARGQIDSGLRAYREAAELADRELDGRSIRTLMTIHQAMSILHLGLLGHKDVVPQLYAGALPTVDLPGDWLDRPEFVLLSYVSERRGWEWPLSIGP